MRPGPPNGHSPTPGRGAQNRENKVRLFSCCNLGKVEYAANRSKTYSEAVRLSTNVTGVGMILSREFHLEVRSVGRSQLYKGEESATLLPSPVSIIETIGSATLLRSSISRFEL